MTISVDMTDSQEFHLHCSAAYAVIIKTLDHKNEYMLQSWAYVNTWYFHLSKESVNVKSWQLRVHPR